LPPDSPDEEVMNPFHGVGGGGFSRLSRGPVAAGCSPAIAGFQRQGFAREEPPGGPEKGLGGRRLGEDQGFVEGVRIDLLLNSRSEEGFDLRGKDEAMVGVGEVEGLDPEVVTGEKEGVGLQVKEGEGKNTVEILHHPVPLFLVKVNEHLAVTRTLEAVSLPEQILSEFPEVVDLPVED